MCNLPTSPDRCIASAFLPSARKESLGLGLSSKVNAGGSPTAFLQITYVYCIVSGVPPPRFALLVCRMLRGVGHWGREQEQEQDHRNSRTEKPTCDDFSLLEKVREMRLRLSTSLKHGRGRERVRWIRAPPGLSLDFTCTAWWKPNCGQHGVQACSQSYSESWFFVVGIHAHQLLGYPAVDDIPRYVCTYGSSKIGSTSLTTLLYHHI